MRRGGWLALLATLACGTEESLPLPERPPSHVDATGAWVAVRAATDRSLFELPAKVVAAPEGRASVEIPYRATVVSIAARAGDPVERGAPLAELRVPELLQAAASLESIAPQLDAYERRRQKLVELQGRGLVQAGEVFDVESGLGRLSAEQALALSTLRAFRVEGRARRELLRRGTVVLTAPVTGVLMRLDAHLGGVIEAGVPIAEIAGLGEARIEVMFSGTLDTSVDLQFVTDQRPPIPLDPVPVSTTTEPRWGRTIAWFRPRSSITLTDGLQGRVLLASTDPGLFEVPNAALRLHAGRAWVGRRGDGPAPDMVEVEVVRSLGEMALVRSEHLGATDEVTVEASEVLRLGAPDEPAVDGHHHHG